MEVTKPSCSGFEIIEDDGDGIQHHGFQNKDDLYLWERGEVKYSIVSNGEDSELNEMAVFQDSKVGFSRAEFEVIKKAMDAIENDTCIRFEEVMPEPNTKWALFMKKSSGRDKCYEQYITDHLKNLDVRNRNGENLGKIFEHSVSSDALRGCSGNVAFVSYSVGTQEPTLMVSDIEIKDREGTVGLFIHELLHVLGIGHTHKRKGVI